MFGGIAQAGDDPLLSTRIHTPTNGAVFTLNRGIGISALAYGQEKVVKVEFYDGPKLVATDTNAPYNFSWRTSARFNGPHIWTSRAYGAGGSIATSAPVRITLDLDPSAPELAAPSATPPPAPKAVRFGN